VPSCLSDLSRHPCFFKNSLCQELLQSIGGCNASRGHRAQCMLPRASCRCRDLDMPSMEFWHGRRHCCSWPRGAVSRRDSCREPLLCSLLSSSSALPAAVQHIAVPAMQHPTRRHGPAPSFSSLLHENTLDDGAARLQVGAFSLPTVAHGPIYPRE
jgi:hypothetical protein